MSKISVQFIILFFLFSSSLLFADKYQEIRINDVSIEIIHIQKNQPQQMPLRKREQDLWHKNMLEIWNQPIQDRTKGL